MFEKIFRKILGKNKVNKDREEIILDSITQILKSSLEKCGARVNDEEIRSLIRVPRSFEAGDYSFPCSIFAKRLNYEPHEFALILREKIGNIPPADFDYIQTSGTYINFFLDRKNLAREVLWDVISQRSSYGMGNEAKKEFNKSKKIVIDSSDSYIGMPLDMNYLRSSILGNSINNICGFQGFKSVKLHYFKAKDIEKLIHGFQEFGNEKKLHEDPIRHLSYIYKKSSKNELALSEIKKKLEQRDKKSIMLWRTFKELSLEKLIDFNKTIGVDFDDYFAEFESTKELPVLIEELKKSNLLKSKNKESIVDLRKYNLGISKIMDKYGASTEVARNIIEAVRRKRKYNFYKMVYCVNDDLEIKQSLQILKLLGYNWADDCIVIKHGSYLGKNKKKLSGKNNVNFVFDILKDMTVEFAKSSVSKPNVKINFEEYSLKFTLNSLIYESLKGNSSRNIILKEDFIQSKDNHFRYIMNSYNLASSILESNKKDEDFIINDLEKYEVGLVKELLSFRKVSKQSYYKLNPDLIAEYSYNLSKMFNKLLTSFSLSDPERSSFRIALIESYRQVLRNSLNLLGINIINKK